MSTRFCTLLLVGALCASAIGCGDSDDDDASTPDASTAADAGTPPASSGLPRPGLPRPPVNGLPDELRPPR